MRELKFRAWDNNDKRYRYAFNMDDFGKVIEYVDGEKVYMPYIIEQYTGLKDKNGKEIYEGDILQIDDHILGDFVVVWHNFGWKIKRSVGYEPLSVHKSEDCTVIGNIHENPELLGGKE